MVLLSQVLAGALCFVYASFLEWTVHRHFMHARRFPFQDAFRGHTLAHHQIYKDDHSYQKEKAGVPNDVLMRWYALPGLILPHVPVLYFFERLTGIPSMWGGLIAITVYAVGYEYTHYLMHIPRGHFVERFRWFQFICNHHRLHHKYMLSNLNVFCPLADFCLGTLITSESTAADRRRIARRKTNRNWRLLRLQEAGARRGTAREKSARS